MRRTVAEFDSRACRGRHRSFGVELSDKMAAPLTPMRGLERWQVLLLADEGSEGVADVMHSVENGADRPAVRREVGIL